MRQFINIVESEAAQSPDRLEVLFRFMQAVKQGDRSGDIKQRERIPLTSHNLELVSDQIEYGWLVHFTEQFDQIKADGFRGVQDHRLLGQTRSIKQNFGPNGYNYAFPIPSKEASYEQSRNTGIEAYGGKAFAFKARYVRVFHKGDRQIQALFLSSEFNPTSAIELISMNNTERDEAISKYARYERTKYADFDRQTGQFIPSPDHQEVPLEQLRAWAKQSKGPAVLWKIENGPLAGKVGGWAQIIKAITK